MPNYSVFQTDPNNLRTLINGRDPTGTNQIVRTDTSGNITDIMLAGTLTSLMGATITAGTITTILSGTITNLLNGTLTSVLGATITAGTITNLLDGTITSVLGATITAGTITNLLNGTITSVLGATITAGTLSSVTSISQRSFVEQQNVGVLTSNTFTALPAITTAVLGTYSFFVYNTVPGGSIDTQVEISADGVNYFIDTTSSSLASGSIDVLIPSRFLKYTRLSYRSTALNTPATVNVIFDAQGT